MNNPGIDKSIRRRKWLPWVVGVFTVAALGLTAAGYVLTDGHDQPGSNSEVLW